MHIMRYWLGHRLLCVGHLYELHMKSPACSCIRAGDWSSICYMRLCYGCCDSCCISQERGLTAAMQPGESLNVFSSSYSSGSLSLLPASLVRALPTLWVQEQQTV